MKYLYTEAEASREHANGTIILNTGLLERQKITKKGLTKLLDLHEKLQDVYSKMRAEDSPIALKELDREVTLLNFELQKVWGFPQNADFHHWYTVPKCQCPRMDNLERYGTRFRIISANCPVHGE